MPNLLKFSRHFAEIIENSEVGSRKETNFLHVCLKIRFGVGVTITPTTINAKATLPNVFSIREAYIVEDISQAEQKKNSGT